MVIWTTTYNVRTDLKTLCLCVMLFSAYTIYWTLSPHVASVTVILYENLKSQKVENFLFLSSPIENNLTLEDYKGNVELWFLFLIVLIYSRSVSSYYILALGAKPNGYCQLWDNLKNIFSIVLQKCLGKSRLFLCSEHCNYES